MPKLGANRGNAGKGRPKGSPNKTTAVLKDAIILAADQTGQDGKGKDGLTGYLRHIAQTNVAAFSALLGRVLPLQVGGDPENPIEINVTIGGHAGKP